ncbi:MAG TPA: response regulator transcription factor [Dongiaceae bacterium]|nr:response regulator transcription factor [Dongiaceae bacterium]
MDTVRVLLADDHPHFAEMLERLLLPGFEVIGKVRDGRALVESVLRLKPDLILTDISMPVLNGIDAIEELRGMGSTTKVIFVTVHSDAEFVKSCLATGALGYVVKPRIALDLAPAIRQVLAGQVFVSESDAEG